HRSHDGKGSGRTRCCCRPPIRQRGPTMRYVVAFTLGLSVAGFLSAGEFQFRDQELPTKLAIGYAVRLLDMNADQRPDICIVDKERILWLENPNWTEHVILQGQTLADNVCFAPYDIDGDGRLDFAVGADWHPANTKSGGTIEWITGGKNPAGQWALHAIAEQPTTHRMNFADLD